jgi:hypothetical protein
MAGMVSNKQERLARELARLASLDRVGCLDLWRTCFGCEAPRYLSAVFMRKALAHEAQCRLLGRLPASDVRSLRSIASGKTSAARVTPTLAAGTHLVREWNGRAYQVEVTKSGYVMDGKTYRSLTAIAKRITGANWSGPRFFGLVDRQAKQQDGDESSSASNQRDEQGAGRTVGPTSVDSAPPELRPTDSEDSGISAAPLSGLIEPCPADVRADSHD